MNTRPANLFEASRFILLMIMVSLPTFTLGSKALVHGHETDDGLELTIANGRVTDLKIGIMEPDFCIPGSGGFYIRDYTVDPTTGLPGNLDTHGNLLDCSDFDSDCTSCLLNEEVWTIDTDILVDPDITCADLTLTSGSTTVAKLVLPEDDTGPFFIGIYQDIHLSQLGLYPNPTTHDLFCFSFDLATACGFRSKDHPDGTLDEHGEHKIISRIDWFTGSEAPTSVPFTPSPPGDLPAVGYTQALLWESTGLASSDDPGLDEFLSCGIRSYRPLDATYVRVGVIVEGYLPNTGVDNAVYFDNFAFYKAPPIVHVKTDDLLTEDDTDFDFLQELGGTPVLPNLQMKASVNTIQTTGGGYLLIDGVIKNLDLNPSNDLPARALDLGFALPIDYHQTDQKLTWWDDMGQSEIIGDCVQILPFRNAGPVDVRPRQTSKYHAYPDSANDDFFSLHTEGTMMSSYPFSALSIDDSTYLRGISFGDDLSADTVAVSHFGYRVLQPDAPYTGLYYVEFNLGILPENTLNNLNETPFSFILFRGDNTSWREKSTFREAANRYQVEFFPQYFTRPTLPSSHPDHDWQFGGGFYNGEVINVSGSPQLVSNTFNNHASGYGLRYTQEPYTGVDNQTWMQGVVNLFNSIHVGTLVYEQPWLASFHNPTGTSMNQYTTLDLEMTNYSPVDDPPHAGQIWEQMYFAKRDNALHLPGGTTLFGQRIDDFSGSSDKLKYNFPTLLVDSNIGDADLLAKERLYIGDAYGNVSNDTVAGLKGMECDNAFYSRYDANHLDQTSNRLSKYVAIGGRLTYSINHLAPAIPQVAANVLFLKDMQDKLGEIDAVFPFGDGSNPTHIEDEILSGNFNEPLFGASKYGVMNCDIGGFESRIAQGFNRFNRSEQAQNFRRAMARDKNMARLIGQVPLKDCILDVWQTSGCSNWDNLWGTGNYNDFQIQIVNEAAWVALAWGFMPSISNIFRVIDDNFFDSHILPLFETDPQYGLSYTNIFRELHLSGWRPITNIEVLYEGVTPETGIRVERFGDTGDSNSPGDSVCFTVLNNDDLTVTTVDLAKIGATGTPAAKSIGEIEELEEYRRTRNLRIGFLLLRLSRPMPTGV